MSTTIELQATIDAKETTIKVLRKHNQKVMEHIKIVRAELKEAKDEVITAKATRDNYAALLQTRSAEISRLLGDIKSMKRQLEDDQVRELWLRDRAHIVNGEAALLRKQVTIHTKKSFPRLHRRIDALKKQMSNMFVFICSHQLTDDWLALEQKERDQRAAAWEEKRRTERREDAAKQIRETNLQEHPGGESVSPFEKNPPSLMAIVDTDGESICQDFVEHPGLTEIEMVTKRQRIEDWNRGKDLEQSEDDADYNLKP